MTISFLRESSLFNQSGFTNSSIAFTLNNLSIEIVLTKMSFGEQLSKWYDGFECKNSNHDISLKYIPLDYLDKRLQTKLIEENPRYRNVHVVTKSTSLFDHEIAVFRWDFRALIDLKQRIGRVILMNINAASIDAVARIASSLLFPLKGCLLVHGSSIIQNNKGYLFLGVSGSGKSTIAELSNATILNDEISLISIEDNGEIFIQGTPFYGDLKQGANLKSKLEAIYLIQQSNKTHVCEIDSFHQNLALLRNIVCFSREVSEFDIIIKLIDIIIGKVSIKQLFFEKNKNFLEVI